MKAAAPFDVLCAGLVCVDLVLSVPHHPGSDEKLRALSRLVTPGGPAAVAAAQIARLGGRTAFAGLIGDETHDPFVPLLRRDFAAEGIDTSALRCLPGHQTPLAALLVKPDATRAVVSHRPEPPLSCNITDKVILPQARVVLTDGHRPEWHGALIAHARASGAPLVLDAGSWSDAVRALAAEADHVVASEACARTALGGRDPAGAADELPSALGARSDATVVATLGPRGLVWRGPQGGGAVNAFSIRALDTTGAGDAFHGAYALGLARGLPFADVLHLASAAGALACTRSGAWPAPADAPELEAFLASQKP
jgi:sugar/nucleoside kinase (ribokinase family)